MTPPPLGIVAGTGFYDLEALEQRRDDTVDTAYGPARVTLGTWHDIPVVFLTRHGPEHTVPPHLIEHRSTIRALVDLGVRDVIGITATGGIDPALRPGDLLCLDDFIDFTRSAPVTFHDGTGPQVPRSAWAGVVHTDMLAPYDAGLRRELLDAAAAAGQPMRDGGVYACFTGPRFETRAEIRLARLAGADVAGMTGAPEVVLAAEAGLRYAAVSLVVNPASGVGGAEPITMAEITGVLAASRGHVLAVLGELVRARAGSEHPVGQAQ
ncbi:MAG: S-methyl-5'-thioinosine phosphorylase [Dermatophilaceae bacterium]